MRLGARGLTLVEVCVTVAIIALAAGVVLPAIGNVSRADLRKASSATASKIREAYDNAALSGLTWRLTFVLPASQKNTNSFKKLTQQDDDDSDDKKDRKPGIYMESTERTMAFDSKTGAFVAAANAADILASLDPPPGEDDKKGKDKDKDEKKGSDIETIPSGGDVLKGLFGINKMAGKANAKVAFKQEGQVPLGDNVHVLDVWTEDMDQASADGIVYMLFFPNGYTQEALIHLEDSEHRVMTVSVAPLTGKCRITSGYLEPPK